VVLYGYYRGIISSRRIAEACRRNVVFMALSADTRPHFTTIAAFVSSLEHEIASHPDRTPQRQLTIIKHPEGPPPRRRSKCNGATQRMQWKFDTPFGRELYSRRMGCGSNPTPGHKGHLAPHGQRSVSKPESSTNGISIRKFHTGARWGLLPSLEWVFLQAR
jgi:hypothetical protein